MQKSASPALQCPSFNSFPKDKYTTSSPPPIVQISENLHKALQLHISEFSRLIPMRVPLTPLTSEVRMSWCDCIPL